MTRSLLAQLIVLYAEKGVTDVKKLAQLVGRSERQIWRAKAELSTDTGDSTDTHDTDTHVSRTDTGDSPPSPQKKGLPHTPSKENNPPTPLEVDSVASAPAEAPQGSKYAFEGRVIKLLPRDFDRWKGAFRNIPDLTAALEVADAYYHEKPIADGKWFFKVSRWLATENLKPKEAQTGRGGVVRWQDQPSPGRRLIADALAAYAKMGEVAQ